MNKRILILAVVFGIGSIITVAYASNTTVTNTSVSTTTVNTSDLVASHDVNTTNLFVTGTCSGCGGGGASEGNFTNYSLVLNETVTGTNGGYSITSYIGTDGSMFLASGSQSGGQIAVVKADGTVVTVQSFYGYAQNSESPYATSLNGEYKIFVNMPAPDTLQIYKNNTLLQQITITNSFYTHVSNTANISISRDGKYICLYGEDPSQTIDRVLVYQGS